MPNILRLYYTKTPGRRPPNGKSDGECFVNMSDLQFGIFNNGATTDYLAVRYFSSLATYKSNDYVIQAGVLYSAKADITTPHAFLGTDWNTVAIPSSGGAQYLPLSGGTLTGPLTGTDATFSGTVQSSNAVINSVAGVERSLSWSANNLKLFYSGVTADGTTWFVASCDNAGNYRQTSLAINRTDSGATFAGALTATGKLTAAVGAAMGSAVAPGGLADVSRHLDLYGGSYGLNVTSSTLNVVAGGASTGHFTGSGLSITGTLSASGSITTNSSMSLQTTVSIAETATNQNAYVGFFTPSTFATRRGYVGLVGGNLVFNSDQWGWQMGMNASGIFLTGGVTTNTDMVCNGNFYTNNGSFAQVTCNGITASGASMSIGAITASGQFVLHNNFLGQTTYPIYYAPGGTDMYYTSDANYKYLFEQGGSWYWLFARSTGSRQWLNNTVWGMILDPSGNFTINGGGYKPGGGSWAASSDIRIKDVVGEYDKGLEEVLKLRPVVYTYKGNHTLTEEPDVPQGPPVQTPEPVDEEGKAFKRPPDDDRRIPPLKWKNGDRWKKGDGAPYPNSVYATAAMDKTPFVGLIAQEVEAIFPGMVKKTKGWIDGVEVDDLRELDTTPLIYALVNAIKALNARVAELEGLAPKASVAKTKAKR